MGTRRNVRTAKTSSLTQMGTRRRSSSRRSAVVGLAGLRGRASGYLYANGLPAAPLIGLRRVTLVNDKKMTRRQLAIIDLSICVVAHFNHMDPSDPILAML